MESSEKWRRASDTARNLFFPLIPLAVIASIWSIAFARSLEANVAGSDGPREPDSVGRIESRHASMGIHATMGSAHPFDASIDTSDFISE